MQIEVQIKPYHHTFKFWTIFIKEPFNLMDFIYYQTRGHMEFGMCVSSVGVVCSKTIKINMSFWSMKTGEPFTKWSSFSYNNNKKNLFDHWLSKKKKTEKKEIDPNQYSLRDTLQHIVLSSTQGPLCNHCRFHLHYPFDFGDRKIKMSLFFRWLYQNLLVFGDSNFIWFITERIIGIIIFIQEKKIPFFPIFSRNDMCAALTKVRSS